MALSTAKHFSLFFFLSLFLSSSHLSHARDLPQSFSKFTNTAATATNAKETTVVVPSKEQEPSFLPDTQTGYGLFGHESGLLPPAATTANAKTPSDAASLATKTATDAAAATTTTNNNPYSYYSKEANYVNEYQQGMSDTRFMDTDSTAAAKNNAFQEAYVTEPKGYTTTTNNNNNYYNTQTQGLSGTSLVNRGYSTTPDNKYYNNEANNNYYNTENKGLSDTRLADRSYPTTNNNNNYYNTQTQGLSDTSLVNRGYTTTNTATAAENYNNNGANNNYYNPEFKGMSDTRLADRSYTTTTTNAASANNYNYNGANSYYNTERQGMSDTRFLENGKYYYHVPKENRYGSNGEEKPREVNYNSKGQAYYGTNENSNMEGYQNQEQFQENDEEFVP